MLILILISAQSCNRDDTISSEYTQIEEKFTSTGPSAVSATILKDVNNKNYKVFYPSIISDKIPVITWGNGTGLSPDNYERIFKHLASWGFIVIDNYDGSTFDGLSIIKSARLMLQENSRPESIFYQKVDVNKIAASGHSQGAGGIVNAYSEYTDGPLIKTIVPIAFPSLLNPKANKVKIPVFFITGKEDSMFSSVNFNKKSYEAVPNQIPAILGARKGAYHEAVMNTSLVTGYLTAWMRYQLMNDKDAAQVFTGNQPEITVNPNWTNVMRKNIP